MQNRPFIAQKGKTVPINWRRGMYRLWLLASAAWIMGWVIYFVIELIRGEFEPRTGGAGRAAGAAYRLAAFRHGHAMGIPGIPARRPSSR